MGLADSDSRLTAYWPLWDRSRSSSACPRSWWRGGGLLAWSIVIGRIAPAGLLAQLGLSRVREFDADRLAAN